MAVFTPNALSASTGIVYGELAQVVDAILSLPEGAEVELRAPLFSFLFEGSAGPVSTQTAAVLREAYLSSIWDLPLAEPLADLLRPMSYPELYLPDGAPPAVGSVFRNRDLAHTYDLLAKHGVDEATFKSTFPYLAPPWEGSTRGKGEAQQVEVTLHGTGLWVLGLDIVTAMVARTSTVARR